MSWATAAIILSFSPSLLPVDPHRKRTIIFFYISLLIQNDPNVVYIIIRGPLATAPPILCSHFGDFARGPCWAMGYGLHLWVTLAKAASLWSRRAGLGDGLGSCLLVVAIHRRREYSSSGTGDPHGRPERAYCTVSGPSLAGVAPGAVCSLHEWKLHTGTPCGLEVEPG